MFGFEFLWKIVILHVIGITTQCILILRSMARKKRGEITTVERRDQRQCFLQQTTMLRSFSHEKDH